MQHEDDDACEILETELTFAKQSLNASIAQLETSNHELQATNEELIASNEELQSTNEELCSVNEELHSVNEEYQRKIDELEQTTSDLEILIRSSDACTVFLDSNLRIRRFTQAATRYFNLVSHDIGRPLTDFRTKLVFPDLHQMLRKVVQTGNMATATCSDEFNEHVFAKAIPHNNGGKITGAVLNFMTYGSVGTWEWPVLKEDRMWWSPTCYQLLEIEKDMQSLFSNWQSLVHPDDLDKFLSLGADSAAYVRDGQLEVRMQCGKSEYRKFDIRVVTALYDGSEVRGFAGTISMPSASGVRRSIGSGMTGG